MLARSCNPSILEVETVESGVQSYPKLHSELIPA